MLQNHSPFVEVMKSFLLSGTSQDFFTYVFVFPAAPISVNPPSPSSSSCFSVFFLLSLLLLISPAAPGVCCCLCFLIFNLGLCSSFVCFFFFSLHLQSEAFLVFPFHILSPILLFLFVTSFVVFRFFWAVLCKSLCQYLQFYIILIAGITPLSHSLVNCGSAGAVRAIFIGEDGG